MATSIASARQASHEFVSRAVGSSSPRPGRRMPVGSPSHGTHTSECSTARAAVPQSARTGRSSGYGRRTRMAAACAKSARAPACAVRPDRLGCAEPRASLGPSVLAAALVATSQSVASRGARAHPPRGFVREVAGVSPFSGGSHTRRLSPERERYRLLERQGASAPLLTLEPLHRQLRAQPGEHALVPDAALPRSRGSG